MRVRRVRLTLPARLKGTAAFDARQIAEAAARALQEGGSPLVGTLRVEGAGRSGVALALEVGSRLRPPIGFKSGKRES